DVPKEELRNSLTAGSLRGAGKFASLPLLRARRDERASIAVTHLGAASYGYVGMVYGGILATLLDELLGRRYASLNLPEKAWVTATLNLSYRDATRTNQVHIKTFVDEQAGRKVRVSPGVEVIEGKVLVEAQVLFFQPRYAKVLSLQWLHRHP
ncbi:HotDog domain-containing protein, partial [Irpex lacteus]